MDTARRLSRITISLHWIVGLTIIGLTGLGLYMTSVENYELYDLHKSIGVVVAFFVVARVWWRLHNGWPKPVKQYPRHEQTLAHIVHWVLIVGSVLMPVSGFLMSALGGYGVHVFSWELFPGQFNANNEAIPYSEAVSGFGAVLHTIVGYALVVAISLHVLGALKHHLLDKDFTLLRMLGFGQKRF